VSSRDRVEGVEFRGHAPEVRARGCGDAGGATPVEASFMRIRRKKREEKECKIRGQVDDRWPVGSSGHLSVARGRKHTKREARVRPNDFACLRRGPPCPQRHKATDDSDSDETAWLPGRPVCNLLSGSCSSPDENVGGLA
jgi:hypothetical protein